jgi:hypothetical protein
MGLLDRKEDVEEREEDSSPIIAEEIKKSSTLKMDKVDEIRTRPRPTTNPAKIVDTENVEFTQSMNFTFAGVLHKKKVGDIMKVSKELRDILLIRECIRIKPN